MLAVVSVDVGTKGSKLGGSVLDRHVVMVEVC